MRSMDGSNRSTRDADGKSPLPGDERGATRRDFICAAGVAGAAVVLASRRPARAQDDGVGEWLDPDMGWEWVDPDEMYDPNYEYKFVDDEIEPEGWEWIDPNEEFDPEYDYEWVEMYEDGTQAEWVMADPEEPFDPEYEYRNDDDSPIEWQYTEGPEVEHPSYHYEYEYEYVDGQGYPTYWEWVEPGEEFDGEYEYVYESAE